VDFQKGITETMVSDPTTRQADFQRYQEDWETNARIDAKWSVLTLAGKLGEGWDDRDFFDIGVREIAEVFRFMEKTGIRAVGALPLARCLDFGCGVGRITQALAAQIPEAYGIDISDSMLRQAQAYANAAGKKNIRFVKSTSSDLATDLGRRDFDFVYTNITLQHLNNDLQREYIRQFSGILAPQGFAVFQIPSVRPRPTLAAKTWQTLSSMKPRNLLSLLRNSVKQGVLPWRIRMEMNILSEAEAEKVATDAGMILRGKGYINWDIFYRTQKFVLETTPPKGQETFPVSPLYFFQKKS
jgi:2-polyprenyl-3-methyl-5-hydroxy-6-metoxy-1,4-benzoquinol methylase